MVTVFFLVADSGCLCTQLLNQPFRYASFPLGTLIVGSVAYYADIQSAHHLEFAQLLSIEAAVHLLNNAVRDLARR